MSKCDSRNVTKGSVFQISSCSETLGVFEWVLGSSEAEDRSAAPWVDMLIQEDALRRPDVPETPEFMAFWKDSRAHMTIAGSSSSCCQISAGHL